MDEKQVPPRISVKDRTTTTVQNAIKDYKSSNFRMFVKTWTKVVIIIGGLFLALLAAIGHHLFYAWLDWQEAGSDNWQAWVDHIGNAFMFLVKFFLSLSLGIALYEIMWMYARIRTLSIQGLDSLFTLNNSIMDFMSVELFRKAKGVMFVALIFWLLPIGVLPTTGSIQVSPRWKNIDRCIVRGLDFDQTHPASIKDRVTYLAVPNSGNYTTYTNEAYRLITTVAYSGNIINFESPCPTGQCNYTLNLIGPGLECQNVSWQDPNAPWYKNDSSQALFNLKDPWYYYQGEAPDGERGKPNGTFWAAWAYAKDDFQTLSPNGIPYLDLETNSSFADDHKYSLNAIKCTDYMANYTLHVTFTYNVMVMKALDRTLLYPIDYTQQDHQGNWGNFAIFELLFRSGNSSTVAGSVVQVGTANDHVHNATGKIMNTNLVEANVDRDSNETGYLPIADFGGVLEQMYKNITFSLLSHKELVYATNPVGGCAIYPNTWVYNSYGKMVLWLCYGISILVTGIICCFGLVALRSNDPNLEFSFSGILKATRNPELDNLIEQNQGSLDGVKLKLDSRAPQPDDESGAAGGAARPRPRGGPNGPLSPSLGNAVRYSFLVADSPLSPRVPPQGAAASGVSTMQSGGRLSPRVTSPMIPPYPVDDDNVARPPYPVEDRINPPYHLDDNTIREEKL